MYSIAAIPFIYAIAGFFLVPMNVLKFNQKFYLITLTGAVVLYGLMWLVIQIGKSKFYSSKNDINHRRWSALFNILTVTTGGLSMFLSALSAFISIMTMRSEMQTRIFLVLYVGGMLYCLIRSGKYLARIEKDVLDEYQYQSELKEQECDDIDSTQKIS